MRASMYQLPVPITSNDLEASSLTRALQGLPVPTFQPQDGVTIATTEEEAKNESKQPAGGGPMDVDAQCDALLRSLPSQKALVSSGFVVMKPMVFEKDDDAHMRVTNTSYINT